MKYPSITPSLVFPILIATVVITPTAAFPLDSSQPGLLDSDNAPAWLSTLWRSVSQSGIVQGYVDPPRLPGPPTSSEGQGWLTRWLSIGGEGSVTLQIGDDNFTLPHRPAAFPAQLYPPTTLPISGFLVSFPTLSKSQSPQSLAPSSPSPLLDPTAPGSTHTLRNDFRDVRPGSSTTPPMFACVPPMFPPRPYDPPKPPYIIAMVERGGCDFANKVRAAQERGAAGVIVGDGSLRDGETDEEGRRRENLITMFSPEDTDSIYIPSVFVSRVSYLGLRDLLANHTDSGRPERDGLWIEISEGMDEGGALSSLLSFALLMPSLFLLATIAVHRVRVARQREAERAPPLLVLSLPERIWTPDIVWEKDSDSESTASPHSTTSPTADGGPTSSALPPPPPISPAQIVTPPAVDVVNPLPELSLASGSRKKARSKSAVSAKKYFSKDECAICMDAFQSGEIVRILPCGHVFHKDECDEWLLKWRKLCPTCRADVTLPPGAPAQGMTMTPVAPRLDDEDIQHHSLLDRATRPIRQTWVWIIGRGRGIQLQADGTAGERTPLVERSPTGSPRTHRQVEGTV